MSSSWRIFSDIIELIIECFGWHWLCFRHFRDWLFLVASPSVFPDSKNCSNHANEFAVLIIIIVTREIIIIKCVPLQLAPLPFACYLSKFQHPAELTGTGDTCNSVISKQQFIDWTLAYFSWNSTQVDATEQHRPSRMIGEHWFRKGLGVVRQCWPRSVAIWRYQATMS